ncbi:MAG: hypothetical protein H7301_11260 [Cryobacterium sp.]|nr:hypothetical protein [Oligoflexia bacterium]
MYRKSPSQLLLIVLIAGTSLTASRSVFAFPEPGAASAVATAMAARCNQDLDGASAVVNAKEEALKQASKVESEALLAHLMEAVQSNNYGAIDAVNAKMVQKYNINLNEISGVFGDASVKSLQSMSSVTGSIDSFTEQTIQLKKEVTELMPQIRSAKDKAGDGVQSLVSHIPFFGKKWAGSIGEKRDAATTMASVLEVYERAIAKFRADSDAVLTTIPKVIQQTQVRNEEVKVAIMTFEETVNQYEAFIEANRAGMKQSEIDNHETTLNALSNSLMMLYDAYNSNMLSINLLYQQYHQLKGAANLQATKGVQSLNEIKSAVAIMQIGQRIVDMNQVTGKLTELAQLGRDTSISVTAAGQASADELKKKLIAGASAVSSDAAKVEGMIKASRTGEVNGYTANMEAIKVLREAANSQERSAEQLQIEINTPKPKVRGSFN